MKELGPDLGKFISCLKTNTVFEIYSNFQVVFRSLILELQAVRK